MILLLGGTAETARFSAAIAEAGFEVLVSTATEIPLPLGNETGVSRRAGPLDVDAMVSLVRERGVRAIVDATHPYASGAHDTARQAASRANVPCLSFLRPSAVGEDDDVLLVAGHGEAAPLATSFGCPVLLTIGSRNLLPYVQAARIAGVSLVARVLGHPASIEACRIAGLPKEVVITGRGPFSVDENRSIIRKYGIGVLVTKDGGAEGGVKAKMEAARREGCRVVVVARPVVRSRIIFQNVTDLVGALSGS